MFSIFQDGKGALGAVKCEIRYNNRRRSW